jgi:hypothetical protein
MQGIEELYYIRSTYMLIIVFIMASFTAIRYSYTNIFRDTYQPVILFTFKPIAEQGGGIKLLSTENVLISVILAASLSFSLLLFLQFYPLENIGMEVTLPSSAINTILIWLLGTFLIGLLFIVKFAYVAFVGWLFDYPLAQSAHYQEYQSMSHVFNFFFVTILGVGLIAMNRISTTFLMTMAIIYMAFFIFRQFVLIFRLYVKGSYSIYYIFSYICSTELIPWIICFGILLNR